MKKLKIWSILMLAVMVMPLTVACGGDDGDSDSENTIPFTKDIIAYHGWKIISSTSTKNAFQMGRYASFNDDGTCKGFHSMETSYEIIDGKMHTYYKQTKEPMFVYTLQSIQKTTYSESYTIRVNGTLDDNSEFIITVETYAIPVQGKE